MERPELIKFNIIAPLVVQEYERYLPTAFDDSMTILEKMNKIILWLNEVGRLSTESVEKWNEVIEWVVTDGLSEAVLKKLDEWLADGTLQELIDNSADFATRIQELEDRVEILELNGTGDGYSVSITKFGAKPNNTIGENRAALEEAIADVDSKGGGVVIVPPNTPYGYIRKQPATHPELNNCVNNVLVMDFSRGSSYDASGGRDGSQVRWFFKTEGNEKDGSHDGNGFWINGDWHPYIFINHNDETADNRRASLFFANNGDATWAIGQGTTTGAELTDDQKTNFKISGNKVSGSSGLTTMMSILKTTGYFGFNVSAPVYDFHFVASRGTSANGVMCLENNKTADVALLLKTINKTRKISMPDTGEIKISNNAAATTVVTITDDGEVQAKGGVNGGTVRPTNPTAGCHYFDLTLNMPLWYRSAGMWYDAAGVKRIG